MIIDQDLHVHTYLSSCAERDSFAEKYLEPAKQNGISTIGLTDHLWDNAYPGSIDWYVPQNFDHVRQGVKDVEKFAPAGIRFLHGAEVEYSLPARKPAITAEHAKELDFLIVPNSHTHITMPKELYADHQKHADYMLQAYWDIIESDISPYITAMAHPFSAVCCPYDNQLLLPLISDAQFTDCFKKTAEKGIAIEINTSVLSKFSPAQIRDCAYVRMFKIARKCGCLFTFGTDAHKPDDMASLEKGYVMASILGLTDSDIKRL